MELAVAKVWLDRLVMQQHLVFIQQRILVHLEMLGRSFAEMTALQRKLGSSGSMDGTKNIGL
jgi:hypothetical protein